LDVPGPAKDTLTGRNEPCTAVELPRVAFNDIPFCAVEAKDGPTKLGVGEPALVNSMVQYPDGTRRLIVTFSSGGKYAPRWYCCPSYLTVRLSVPIVPGTPNLPPESVSASRVAFPHWFMFSLATATPLKGEPVSLRTRSKRPPDSPVIEQAPLVTELVENELVVVLVAGVVALANVLVVV